MDRFNAWLWFVVWMLAGVLFFSMFNINIEGIFPTIIERFMALPTMLLVVPLAIGLNGMLGAIKGLAAAMRCVVFYLIIATVASHLFWQFGASNRSEQTFYQQHSVSVLRLAQQLTGNILLASDQELNGYLYGVYILEINEPVVKDIFLPHFDRVRCS